MKKIGAYTLIRLIIMRIRFRASDFGLIAKIKGVYKQNRKMKNRKWKSKWGADWCLVQTCSPSFLMFWENHRFPTYCQNKKVESAEKRKANRKHEHVPLWSYHWTFDGWRICCDGGSIISVCVSSELLRDGREGRTPMAWHFPMW